MAPGALLSLLGDKKKNDNKFITYSVYCGNYFVQMRIAYKSILLRKNYKKFNVHDLKIYKISIGSDKKASFKKVLSNILKV